MKINGCYVCNYMISGVKATSPIIGLFFVDLSNTKANFNSVTVYEINTHLVAMAI